LQGLNGTATYKSVMTSMDKLSKVKEFNVASSAQLMGQNALSQGINFTLQRHQHFGPGEQWNSQPT
jgi:hypothetical protein